MTDWPNSLAIARMKMRKANDNSERELDSAYNSLTTSEYDYHVRRALRFEKDAETWEEIVDALSVRVSR